MSGDLSLEWVAECSIRAEYTNNRVIRRVYYVCFIHFTYKQRGAVGWEYLTLFETFLLLRAQYPDGSVYQCIAKSTYGQVPQLQNLSGSRVDARAGCTYALLILPV